MKYILLLCLSGVIRCYDPNLRRSDFTRTSIANKGRREESDEPSEKEHIDIHPVETNANKVDTPVFRTNKEKTRNVSHTGTRDEIPSSLLRGSGIPSGREVVKDHIALVTGAAGFVGSHVAKSLFSTEKISVIGLDDMSGGFYENLLSREYVTSHNGIYGGISEDSLSYLFIKGDVKNAQFIHDEIFSKYHIKYIYHLAAYAAEGLSHFVRSFNYRTNLVGSIELLNFAIKFKVHTFVFTSSIAVYGSINDLSQLQNEHRKIRVERIDGYLRESDRPTPEDPYGISKYAFELDLHAAHELYGLNYVIFRPHNVYGPNQNMFDKYRNVVGIFISQISRNEPLTIFGNGEQIRSFSYITDVAPIIASVVRDPRKYHNQIFNIGGDIPYTINTLATSVIISMGKDPNVYPIRKLPSRLEVFMAIANHSKVDHYFNIESSGKVKLSKGLEKTVEWFKKTGKHFLPVEFASVEIREKMPTNWLRGDLEETVICTGTRVGESYKLDFYDFYKIVIILILCLLVVNLVFRKYKGIMRRFF